MVCTEGVDVPAGGEQLLIQVHRRSQESVNVGCFMELLFQMGQARELAIPVHGFVDTTRISVREDARVNVMPDVLRIETGNVKEIRIVKGADKLQEFRFRDAVLLKTRDGAAAQAVEIDESSAV
jgi:hypothetical protein